MLVSASQCHIHSFQDSKHKNHHDRPQHFITKKRGEREKEIIHMVELALLLPERNEGLHLVETMGSCNVALMPQQTRRGHQLTLKRNTDHEDTPSTVLTLAVMNRTEEKG